MELTEAQQEDFMNLLADELDVEVVLENEDSFTEADAIVERELEQLRIAEEVAIADRNIVNKEYIQNELSRLLPNTDGRETTLQAFSRLAGDQAWIPFRSPDSAAAATEVDKAEADYFEEKEGSYSLSAKTGPRSYKKFATDWNLEVSRRFKLWSREGEESEVVQLRLKSPKQLEEYFNKRQELRSLQRTAVDGVDDEDNRDEDNDQALLNTQLRNTRRQLPPRQVPHNVSPPVFTPQANSITPFGHPTALNAMVSVNAIAASLISPQTATPIPFLFQRHNLPVVPPTRPMRKVFKSKMYCSTCGWRKVEHTTAEGFRKGKNMKAGDCRREYCGNCFRMRVNHNDVPFGKDCTNMTAAFCTTNVNDWWTYTVS
jgi:hypothetical protein